MTTAPDRSPFDFLIGVLRGDSLEWPWTGGEAAFIEEARRHLLMPLVAGYVTADGPTARWPAPVREALRESLREHTIREAIVSVEVMSVLDALARAGLPALVLKGTALAYTLYRTPAARRRSDTDMLIRRADRDRVGAVLHELGYENPSQLAGEYVSHQALFRKIDRHGIVHDFDVHWKISNRPLFADMLTWDELAAEAVAVPALGAHARTAGLVHALTLACTHPIAHHGGDAVYQPRWIYDIHLLMRALPDLDVERWLALATRLQIRAVCARGLALANAHFRTTVPARVTAVLADARGEPSAHYLSTGPWIGDVRLSDLRTTPGFAARMQLVREVVLPSPAYMREVYGVSSPLWLPLLYVHRVMRGSWRLLGRTLQHSWRHGSNGSGGH